MSKHKSILWWVIFLVIVVGVLVFCFFEKKEKEIEKSIHQLETKDGSKSGKSNQFFKDSDEGINERIYS